MNRTMPLPLPNLFVAGLGIFIVLGSVALLTTEYWAYALAPGLLFLTVLLIFEKPKFGFYAIVFLVPYANYRNLPGLESLKIHWLIAMCLVMAAFLKDLRRRELLAHLKSPIWPIMILFFLACLIAAYQSPFRAEAAKNLFRLAIAFVFIGLGIRFMDRRSFLRGIPAVVSWAVTIASILAILGYFLNISWFAMTEENEMARGTGASTSANAVAIMISFTIPFVYYRIFHPQESKQVPLGLFQLIVLLIGLGITYSRGGVLVSLFITILYMLQELSRLKPIHIGWFLAGMVALLVLIFTLVPPEFWERQATLLELGSGGDNSLNRRSTYLIVGYESFLENPIIGAGPGVFPEIYKQTNYAAMFADTEKELRRYAHNTYVEIVVGSGLVGLTLFLIWLLTVFRCYNRSIRIAFENRDYALVYASRAYRIAFLAMMIYFLIKSADDHKFFLLIVSMAAVALKVAQGKNDPEEVVYEA